MRVGVAASGGRDSTALLHCVLRQAAPLGIEVVALHVHHGLQVQADQWLVHLQQQVRRWSRRIGPVRLCVTHLQERPKPGDSVEAWARRHRYEALAAMARVEGVDLVLLAHHGGDQAETVLLQALRGGGPRALAAMPERFERHGLHWARPWLSHSRAQIEAYLHRHRLAWIDDPSNAVDTHDRSRLRQRVMPVLETHFPQAGAQLARTARTMAEADAALSSYLQDDLHQVRNADGALSVAAWQGLPAARHGVVLRAWLAQAGCPEAPDTLVERLRVELADRQVGRWPAGPGELRLYRRTLRWFALPAAHAPPPGAAIDLDLSRPGRYPVAGWNGAWRVQEASGPGLPPGLLRAVTCTARRGGESFRLEPGGVRRALKKQYQALGVPAWRRTGPLLWSGDRLLFVPGLGVDAEALQRRATPPDVNLSLDWQPEDPQAPR